MRYLLAAALLAPAVLLGWPAAAGPVMRRPRRQPRDGQMCRLRAAGPNYTINMVFPVDYPTSRP